MKPVSKFRVASLLLLVLAAAFLMVYRYRVLIEAWWWHLRHGETLALGDYTVPAPKNWYVMDMGSENRLLVRLDTPESEKPKYSNRKPRFPATVTIFLSSLVTTREKLPMLSSLESAQVRKAGVEPILRGFEFDGETLSCVGGDTFSHATRSPAFYEVDPEVWRCRSSGRLQLEIVATDGDMTEVWNIISHIRKKT